MQHRIPTLVAAALFTAIGIASASAAHASLIGDTVTLQSFSGANILLDSDTGVAGTDDISVEQYFGDELFTATFWEDTVRITYTTSHSGGSNYLGHLELSGLDWNGSGALAGAWLYSSSNSGITQSDLSISGNTLSISLVDGSWDNWKNADVIEIALEKADVAGIPEPSAAIVFGVGIAIVGRHASRRRRA